MDFFTRLSNGWKISMSSFKVLKENKQLIVFPILSSLSLIVIMGSFIVIFISSTSDWQLNLFNDKTSPFYYLTLFAFYFVNYFIMVFFNMALIHCTRLYFQGEEVTVRKGLQFSLSRIGVIFSWALFAGIVGTILRAIQENSGLLGKIITGFIGFVWAIATFFVVPVIAYENVGPLQAVKRSSQLMKQKWGESLGATFSFSIINIIAFVLAAFLAIITNSLFGEMAAIVVAMIVMFIAWIILSSAQTIFVSAVYHNIKGDPSEHFSQQMIDDLFTKK